MVEYLAPKALSSVRNVDDGIVLDRFPSISTKRAARTLTSDISITRGAVLVEFVLITEVGALKRLVNWVVGNPDAFPAREKMWARQRKETLRSMIKERTLQAQIRTQTATQTFLKSLCQHAPNG